MRKPQLLVEGIEKQMRRSYDRIAPLYNRARWRDDWQSRVMARLIRRLPSGGRVLDLGCGVGIWMKWVRSKGFRVTGLDQSPMMVRYARRRNPGASVVCRNMVNPGFRAGSFDGIVSLFAVIHVPQGKQPDVFRHMYRLLVPGGHFMINIGGGAYEYVGEHCGEWLYWSGASLPETFRRIRRAGLRILWHKGLGPRDDHQIWILGSKPE